MSIVSGSSHTFVDRFTSLFRSSAKTPRTPSMEISFPTPQGERTKPLNKAGIRPYLQANDDIAKLEKAFQLGGRDDLKRPDYTFDQLEARERHRTDTAKFWFFLVKGGRHILDFFGIIAKSHALTYVGKVIGNFIDPVAGALGYWDEHTKNRQQDEQVENSAYVGDITIKNSQLDYDDLREIRGQRLEKIVENKELEGILQRDQLSDDYTFTKDQLKRCIHDNRRLTATQKRLFGGFIRGLNLDESSAISFKELKEKYADHTVALSLMARAALIDQNGLKNKMEKKFFTLKRNTEGWHFSLSLAAGVTWFTLNVLTWAGIGVAADVSTGLGGAFLATGLAITVIGLAVIAYRAPHQFKEIIRGTYLLKSLHELRKGVYKYLLGYNGKLEHMKKKIADTRDKMGAYAISDTKYNTLPPREKALYTQMNLRGERLYILKEQLQTYNQHLIKIEKYEAAASKYQDKLIELYEGSRKYRSKITQAKIKDFQRAHRLYTKQFNQTIYIENLLEAYSIKEKAYNKLTSEEKQDYATLKVDGKNYYIKKEHTRILEDLKKLVSERLHQKESSAKKLNKKVYFENFLDEVATIAASDLSRKTEDRIANDISNLLIRQYCVAVPDDSGKVASEEEIYDAVKQGLDYFMGADIDRMAKINNRLRRGRDAAQRFILQHALFDTEEQKVSEHLSMIGLSIHVDTTKSMSKTYRKKVSEDIRKQISRKLTPYQAMIFYGTLWNLIKAKPHEETRPAQENSV